MLSALIITDDYNGFLYATASQRKANGQLKRKFKCLRRCGNNYPKYVANLFCFFSRVQIICQHFTTKSNFHDQDLFEKNNSYNLITIFIQFQPKFSGKSLEYVQKMFLLTNQIREGNLPLLTRAFILKRKPLLKRIHHWAKQKPV